MTLRIFRTLLLALISTLLTVEVASACRMGRQLDTKIVIQCGDWYHSVPASEYKSGESYPIQLGALSDACGSDLEASRRMLQAEYLDWYRGYELSPLTFARWSPGQEALLRERSQLIDLNSCYSAVEYRRVSDWLLWYPAQQPYCRNVNEGKCCPCPEIRFSSTAFLLFTLIHPLRVFSHWEPSMLPCLLKVVIGFACLLGLAIWLVRKPGQLFKPRRISFIGAAIAAFALFWFGMVYDSLYWAALVYLCLNCTILANQRFELWERARPRSSESSWKGT